MSQTYCIGSVSGQCSAEDRDSYNGTPGKAVGNCNSTYCVCDASNVWSEQPCSVTGQVYDGDNGKCKDPANMDACKGMNTAQEIKLS